MSFERNVMNLADRLELMLRAQNSDQVEEVVIETGLEALANPRLLEYCRITNKIGTVLLISNILYENDIDFMQNKIVYEAYQSLAKQKLSDQLIEYDSKDGILSYAVCKILDQETLDISFYEEISLKSKIALELALDFNKFELFNEILDGLLRSGLNGVEALAIIKIISDRIEALPESSNWGMLGSSYKKLEELCKDLLDEGTRNAISLIYSSILMSGSNYDEAIKAVNSVKGKDFHLTTIISRARLNCLKGSYPETITELDAYIEIALSNLEKINFYEKSETIKVKKPEKKFNGRKAAQALEALRTAMNEVGLDPFLMSGTLLGVIRNGAFLDHDKDIDVGIFGWEKLYDIALSLFKSEEFEVPFKDLRGNDTYTFPIKHKSTGMWIDIFVFRSEGGRYVHGVDHTWGFKQKFSHTKFELRKMKFLDTEMSVPGNPEFWLAEHYGQNWKIPDPGYNPLLECPTLVDRGGAIHMMTGRIILIKAMAEKNIDKFIRTFNVLDSYPNSAFKFDSNLRSQMLSVTHTRSKPVLQIAI
jgi:hypothetical protein